MVLKLYFGYFATQNCAPEVSCRQNMAPMEDWTLPDRCPQVWRGCHFCRHAPHSAQVRPHLGGAP